LFQSRQSQDRLYPGGREIAVPTNRLHCIAHSGRLAMPGKPCAKCYSPFKGFGDVCGECRVLGSAGALSACSVCGCFFQGFGSQCWDCQGHAQQVAMSMPVFKFSEGLTLQIPTAPFVELHEARQSQSSCDTPSSWGTPPLATSISEPLSRLSPRASARAQKMTRRSDVACGLWHRRSRKRATGQRSSKKCLESASESSDSREDFDLPAQL